MSVTRRFRKPTEMEAYQQTDTGKGSVFTFSLKVLERRQQVAEVLGLKWWGGGKAAAAGVKATTRAKAKGFRGPFLPL